MDFLYTPVRARVSKRGTCDLRLFGLLEYLVAELKLAKLYKRRSAGKVRVNREMNEEDCKPWAARRSNEYER